jgi:hypothetical protein
MGELDVRDLISLLSRAAKSRRRMCHVRSVASASFYDGAVSLSYGMMRILSGPRAGAGYPPALPTGPGTSPAPRAFRIRCRSFPWHPSHQRAPRRGRGTDCEVSRQPVYDKSASAGQFRRRSVGHPLRRRQYERMARSRSAAFALLDPRHRFFQRNLAWCTNK